MEIESRQQIIERQKEIEKELLDMLKEAKSDFGLDNIKKIIYNEKGQDDLTDIIAMFDTGQGAAELQNVLELVNDAWNYFPHKIIGGFSPAEKLLEYRKKTKIIMKINNAFKLIVAIVVSELAGIVGSFFTISAIPTWYAGLVKPMLNPPSWVFGPVWTTLYALMGIAAFLVWKAGWERKEVRMALKVFVLQLFLNAIWSIIFFGLHSPGWALVDIILFWLAIVWTITVFYKISKPVAYLLVPYILWVSFASYLNYSIWMLN